MRNSFKRVAPRRHVRPCQTVHVDRKTLSFVALVITILYGAGFAVFDESRSTYAVIGGAVVSIAWIAVGYFGKPDDRSAPPTTPPEESAPPH